MKQLCGSDARCECGGSCARSTSARGEARLGPAESASTGAASAVGPRCGPGPLVRRLKPVGGSSRARPVPPLKARALPSPRGRPVLPPELQGTGGRSVPNVLRDVDDPFCPGFAEIPPIFRAPVGRIEAVPGSGTDPGPSLDPGTFLPTVPTCPTATEFLLGGGSCTWRVVGAPVDWEPM